MRIIFALAAPNDLNIKYNYSQNDYINSNPKEELFFYSNGEFFKDKGKLVIVVCALYGLKFFGSAWTEAIHQFIRNLGFQPY